MITMKTMAELNVRAGPGTQYRVIGTIKKGIEVNIDSIGKNWAKLSNNKGYVSALYLE